MNNKIIWETDQKPIEEKEIEKVEKKLDIIFPQEYKDCIKIYHGGYPRPYVYDAEYQKEKIFGYLLSFSSGTPLYILDKYTVLHNRLIKNVYPFADDPFGNYICFDYRAGKEKPPKIVFWDHEQAAKDTKGAIHYICDSFTELLDKLYDPEEK